jgi:phage nucleotide-binding protein
VFGDNGCGKTVLLGTAPKALFLACDNSTDTAKGFGSKAEVWPVRRQQGWEDIRECTMWCYKEGHKEYDWLLVDNVTVAQQLYMGYLLRKAHEANKSRDPDIPIRNDYLKSQMAFLRWIQFVNALPMNVMFSAWQMWLGEEGESKRVPALHGQKNSYWNSVCGEMRFVHYLGVNKEGEHGLVTRQQPSIFAKPGYDQFPKTIVNPTVPKLMDYISKATGA